MFKFFVLLLFVSGVSSQATHKCSSCAKKNNELNQITNINFADFVKSSAVAVLPGNVLKVSYVPSSRGTNVIYASKEIPSMYKNEAMLEFEVFFDKDFEWVNGGKMHGLLSGSPKTVSTGCVSQPKNGWSFRSMWRGDGRISLYIYDQSRLDNGQACGIGMDSTKNILTKNKWINIKMYMRLNTKSSTSDGVAKLYVDNKLILQRNNIKFRGVDSGATIDYVTFTTFYGGHDPWWSPSKTTYASYRGAKIHKHDLHTSV